MEVGAMQLAGAVLRVGVGVMRVVGYTGNGGGSGSYTPRSGSSSRSGSYTPDSGREVEGLCLEVTVTPCRQRSQVAVGLEVHLYRQAKRDMMTFGRPARGRLEGRRNKALQEKCLKDRTT